MNNFHPNLITIIEPLIGRILYTESNAFPINGVLGMVPNTPDTPLYSVPIDAYLPFCIQNLDHLKRTLEAVLEKRRELVRGCTEKEIQTILNIVDNGGVFEGENPPSSDILRALLGLRDETAKTIQYGIQVASVQKSIVFENPHLTTAIKVTLRTVTGQELTTDCAPFRNSVFQSVTPTQVYPNGLPGNRYNQSF
jgi:hypothetical protein